jgi:hypothetical protein
MRRLSFLAVATILAGAAGCDLVDRARGVGTGTHDLRDLVTLTLEAPGMVSPGEVSAIRLSIRNASDTTVTGFWVELLLPAWMEPGPPEPVGTTVTMVSSGEGTALRYPVAEPPLAAGEARTVVQPVRIPRASWEGADISPSRTVRARLIGADGSALGPTVQTEVAVDPAAFAAEAGGGADGGAPRVTADGVGGVRLGMSEEAVRQLPAAVRDTVWSAEGMRQDGLVLYFQDGGGNAVAELVNGRVHRVFVVERGPTTAEGLGVGSRFEELRAAYGRVCSADAEGRTVVWFPEKPGISFVVRGGATDDTAADRGISPSATVSQLFVRRGTDSC